jgi:PPP family 3-phenylpropionic acid transporter
LPAALLLLFAAIWVASLTVPEGQRARHPEGHESIGRVLRRPAVAALLLVCFLMQASHGPYYTFFTIYMEGHGYSRGAIGQLWALGVVAEIGVFLLMHRLVPRFGLRALLLASLLLAALRWLLIGLLPGSLPVVLFAQLLHAASFGVFHASAIALFHLHFRGRHQGRGQALYSSLSFGAGGAVGAYYAGVAWEGIGPGATYAIAAALAFAGALVGWRWIDRAP